MSVFAKLRDLRRYGSALKWTTFLLLLGTAMLCARTAFARPQNGTPTIRVESGEVMVPVEVSDWRIFGTIQGLTARDFRLFEDGKEQKIQQVAVERSYNRAFFDNFGVKELEWAWTPGQKWATVGGEPFAFGVHVDYPFYLLSYAPPDSAPGSCHKIKVNVDRIEAAVFARDEYCHVSHSPSDPLAGTRLSEQMEEFDPSNNSGKIPFALQTGVLYRDPRAARVYIAVEFPPSAIKFRDSLVGFRYEIGVLQMAYKRDGTLALRSSDIDENSGGPLEDTPDIFSASKAFMPNHHEAQMELLPGDYDLRVVLSDGSKFGGAEVPLTVESYDGKTLGMSSMFICKQFHDHSQTEVSSDPSRPSTLIDFVPLVSKGMEFTPTADTTFRKKNLLFVYYEIYEPLLATIPATTVQTRLRIINTKTSQVETDTGWRGTADWMQAGNPVIAVSQEVKLKKLAKGSYRIEVQASDSAGRSTDTRAATFTIE